jgi:type IV secretion system protein VirB2
MSDVFASTTGNDVPFAGAMNKLKDAIAGPFLFAVTIIMIITTCFMLAFGEWGQGFMKVITLVFYLSIAFGAVQFVTWLYGSGAVF